MILFSQDFKQCKEELIMRGRLYLEDATHSRQKIACLGKLFVGTPFVTKDTVWSAYCSTSQWGSSWWSWASEVTHGDLMNVIGFLREKCNFIPVGLQKPLNCLAMFVYVISSVGSTHTHTHQSWLRLMYWCPRLVVMKIQFCYFCAPFLHPHLAYCSSFWFDSHV